VIVTNQLFRWTASGWTPDISVPGVAAWAPLTVNSFSQWIFVTNGNLAPDGPTATFQIGLHGYYYAIAQNIMFVNRATGQVTYSDYRFIDHPNPSGTTSYYYCKM
jgi:hypothetical protein